MNMLTPLDFGVIDHSVLVERQLRHGNAIGAHTLSHVICYNKKKWPGEHYPKSSGGFLGRAKVSGRRVLRREEVCVTEAALQADGVKEDEFYPIDVARVFRSLDRIKPHINAWYYDNSQAQQLMEQEEVDLIAMMNGRATESILNAKAPFEIVWNEAICEGGIQGWIVPMGCPNPKGAMKSRHRRARGIPGGVRPPDVLRAAKSQGFGSARTRHRQADADLSRERATRTHHQFRVVGRQSADDAAALSAMAAILGRLTGDGSHALAARSKGVAVVGASQRRGRGTNVIANLRDCGFAGEIFAVNPRYQDVLGCKCFPTVSDLPASVDCLVVAVAADAACDVLEEANAHGITAAIVLASRLRGRRARGCPCRAAAVARGARDVHLRAKLFRSHQREDRFCSL